MKYFLPVKNAKVAGPGRGMTEKHIFPSLQNGNIFVWNWIFRTWRERGVVAWDKNQRAASSLSFPHIPPLRPMGPSIARFREKKNAKSGSTPLITVSTKNVWINFVSRRQYQISLSIARGLSTYPDIFNCLMLVEDHADRGLHTNYDNFTTRNNARAVKFAQYKGSTKKKFRT